MRVSALVLLAACGATGFAFQHPQPLHRPVVASSRAVPPVSLHIRRAAPPPIALASAESADDAKRLPPEVLPITLAVFVQLLGEGIAISTIPLHMRSMGASAPMVGFATSCFSLMQMICCPLFVRSSGRFGRRRILRTCLAGSSMSLLLIALSPNVYGILLGRMLGGVFAASIPVAQAGVTDMVKPSLHGLALSRVAAASQAGVVVGPAVAALGCSLFAFFGLPAHMHVRATFASASAFAICVLALSRASSAGDAPYEEPDAEAEEAASEPPPEPATAASPPPPPSDPRAATDFARARSASEKTASVALWNRLPGASLLRQGGFSSQIMLRVIALSVGWSLTLSVSTYCLFAATFLGYAQQQLSATFSCGAALTVLTQIWLFPRLVRAAGEHVACALGLSVLSASLSGAALFKAQPLHSTLYFASRVGAGVADTSTVTLVARTSADSLARSRNLALIQSTRAGARIFTPVISGFLFERSKLSAVAPGALPYLVVASLLATLVPVPLVLRRFEESREAKTA